jgi:hypothetical protein
MRARECDACGKLVPWDGAVTLAVDIPTAPDRGQGWSDLDICKECLSRPVNEVLQASCEGFTAVLEGKDLAT